MVITGRAKFQKVMSSMALVAVPMNRVLPSIQPQEARIGERPVVAEAKSATRITPETYSGVAVEAMEKVDSTRSVREPSRMPDSTPRISDVGTMTSMTASISQPVWPSAAAQNFGHRFLEHGRKCPSALQQTAEAGRGRRDRAPLAMQRPRISPLFSVLTQPGSTPSHWP